MTPRTEPPADPHPDAAALVVTIEPAAAADAGELLTLQRAAYATEALRYGDPRLPPLTETLDELRAAVATGTAILVARLPGGRIAGSVRARVDGDTCHLGRLVVAPDLQGRGIGSRLLAEAERRTAGAVARFALFTGHLSEDNLRLYRRLGYVEVARRPLSRAVTEVHLHKPAPDAPDAVSRRPRPARPPG